MHPLHLSLPQFFFSRWALTYLLYSVCVCKVVLEEATEEDKAPESSVNVVGDNSKENNNETVNDKIVRKPALNSNSCGDSKKAADLSEKPLQARSRPTGSSPKPRPCPVACSACRLLAPFTSVLPTPSQMSAYAIVVLAIGLLLSVIMVPPHTSEARRRSDP